MILPLHRIVFVALLAIARLRAHDPGLSTTEVVLRSGAIEVSVGYAPADLRFLLPAGERSPASWSSSDFAAAKGALLRIAPSLWTVKGESGPLAPAEPEAALAAGNTVNFRLKYRRPSGGRVTMESAVMDRLPPGHRDFLTVTFATGAVLLEKLVDAKTGPVELPLPAAGAEAATGVGTAVAGVAVLSEPESRRTATFWDFLRLGVEHIWTGYDHLLFLFGLLVVCRKFSSIIKIISCFTIAHSLTLALATLNVVTVPSRIIEPLIAASIVFVGVENLLRRGAEPPGRWALTFCFGLIHGFGFASVLRELGVGANGRGLAMPLFTFNLGVEIGQVSIAILVLPIVWRLRKNETFLRRGVPVLSAIVAAAGLYWLLQRTLFA